MKLRGEVIGVRSLGDEVAVTLENIDRLQHPLKTGSLGPPFTFRAPIHAAKFYPIGRIVTIEVTPK